MNNKSVGAICFIVGSVISGVSTYFYMRNWCDKKIEEEVNRFKIEYRGGVLMKRESDLPGRKDKEVKVKEGYAVKSSLDDGPVDISTIEYNKLVENAKADPKVTWASEKANENSKFISVEEFDEGEDSGDFDRADLIWYLLDDCLVDEYDEEVFDREKIIGYLLNEDFRDKLMNPESDLDLSNTLYIRNSDSEVQYAIDIEPNISFEDHNTMGTER